ncbi:hypothetical protein [Saliphagus sp. LR7]|uniref:hypothetical protein n=1 Tax=Saliphagus sp. LR7 TaxID=2282654 RepID=UPI000DF7CF89|nr:hypothetical protein [Saliphagus sp. LR7]
MAKFLEDYQSTGAGIVDQHLQKKDFEIPVIAEEFFEEPDRVNVRVKHEEGRKLVNIPVMLPSAGDGYGEVPPIELPQPGMLTVPDVPMEALREDSDYHETLDKHRDHVAEDGYFKPGLRYDDQEAVESAPGDYDRAYPGGYRERHSEDGSKSEAHPSGHTIQRGENGVLMSSPGDEQLCYVSGGGMMMASAATAENGGDDAGSDAAWDEDPIEDGAINWDAYNLCEVTEEGATLSTPVGEDGERSEQTVSPQGIESAFPIQDPNDPETWESCIVGMGEDGCRLRVPTEKGFQEGFNDGEGEDELEGFCEIAVDGEKIRCQTDEADIELTDGQFKATNEEGAEMLAEGENVACVSPQGASVGCSGGTMEATDPEGNSVTCDGSSVSCSDSEGNSMTCDGSSVTAESAAGHSMSVDQSGISGETADGTEFGIEDGQIEAKTSQGGEMTVTDAVGIPNLETDSITNGRYREDTFEDTISGLYTIDPEAANHWHLTLQGNAEIEIADTEEGEKYGEQLWVVVQQDDVGGHTVQWPAETVWTEGEAHEISTGSGARDALSFVRTLGEWYGIVSGKNMQTA